MLTYQEISNLVKENKGSKSKMLALSHQNRIALHSSIEINKSSVKAAEFLRWVQGLLPSDKFDTFNTLLRTPVATIGTTSVIYDFLSKVFHGTNPVIKHDFSSEGDQLDWAEFSKGSLKWWKEKAIEAMRSDINSMVVVDLPSEQMSKKPEPYVYFVPLSSIEAYEEEDGVIKWVKFKIDENLSGFYDDTSYTILNDRVITSQVPHDLGICPVSWFWASEIGDTKVKRHPLTDVLNDLDYLLKLEVENEYLNLYARWPIITTFKSDCTYHSEDSYCDNNGLLKDLSTHEYHKTTGGRPAPCPVCESKRLIGAGTIVEIDPPSAENDKTDLRNPVSIVTIDTASLEYNNNDVLARRLSIISRLTGKGNDLINSQALNESQVTGHFEAMEQALYFTQQNIEKIMSWTDDVICQLRYGQSYKGNIISLGTKHFLLSSPEILSLYEQAKRGGISHSILDQLHDLYIKTEFHNNAQRVVRERMLTDLDNLRHVTPEEAKELYKLGIIDRSEYLYKTNMSSLILKFERENMPIELFGEGVEYMDKINTISETLKSYIKPLEVIEEIIQ